jgi:hypothetical protein
MSWRSAFAGLSGSARTRMRTTRLSCPIWGEFFHGQEGPQGASRRRDRQQRADSDARVKITTLSAAASHHEAALRRQLRGLKKREASSPEARREEPASRGLSGLPDQHPQREACGAQALRSACRAARRGTALDRGRASDRLREAENECNFKEFEAFPRIWGLRPVESGRCEAREPSRAPVMGVRHMSGRWGGFEPARFHQAAKGGVATSVWPIPIGKAVGHCRTRGGARSALSCAAPSPVRGTALAELIGRGVPPGRVKRPKEEKAL